MIFRSATETANPVEKLLAQATAALQAGKLPEVAEAAKRVLIADARNLQAYWLWGLATMDMYHFAEAETALAEGGRHVPADSPLRARFYAQQARALVALGRHGEARGVVMDAMAILQATPAAADPETLHILGSCLSQAGGEMEALPALRWATRLDRRNPNYWFTLGETAQFAGLLQEAEQAFETSVAAGPQTGAHLALARLKRWTRDHNHIARLTALAPRTALDIARRAYALFKEYDDLGDHDAAWAWLQTGAVAALDEPETPLNPAWSAEEERETLDAWKTYFPVERFAKASRATPSRSGPRRIFIIGLPRSGTTLVERILAAHTQVRAAGELQSFPAGVKITSGARGWALLDADIVKGATAADPRDIAAFYERETAHLDDGHAYIIDKLPRNSDYAGLIRLVFPDAVIVHVQREPLDALFGAYKLHFIARWSYRLEDLADHYANQMHLMAHWRSCLGDGLVDVSLEALIADPDTQIRRLLDRCQLPFEEACLHPHQAAGAVASASSSQVRKPINAEGVGAWKRYAAGLDPLRRRLEAMGAIDTNGHAL